jgi:phosphoribosylformylglycinamidine cyclo-ligase
MTKADRYAAAGVKLDTAEEANAAHRRAGADDAHAAGARQGRRIRGMVRVPEGYTKPVLVMSTDGVARRSSSRPRRDPRHGRRRSRQPLGQRHSRARRDALAFLDYIATGTLVPEIAEQIVRGVVRGCLRARDDARRR